MWQRLRRGPVWAAFGLVLLVTSVHAEGPKLATELRFPNTAAFPSKYASAASDAGYVVGSDGNSGVLWRGADPPLAFRGSLGSTTTRAVNNLGQVVGKDNTRAMLWTAQGGFVDLGTLGGFTSDATDINDHGQVVGSAETAAGVVHAFLWTAAQGMLDLGTLGGTASAALGINAVGHVVGYALTAAGESHAFRWTQSGGMVDLGTLGGPTSIATDINASGVVVGWRQLPGTTLRGAFRWTLAGGMVDLTADDDTWSSEATAINDSDQVVGNASNGRAFSWTPAGGLVWLGGIPALTNGNQYTLSAGDITNNGLIVGGGFTYDTRFGATYYALKWRRNRDDVAADLGSAGVWLYGEGGTAWTPVHPFNPTSMARADVDGNGVDDLALNFGPGLGVWLWMDDNTWRQLHPFSATTIVAGDLDGNGQSDLVLDFPGFGIWSWENNTTWRQIHNANAGLMATGRVTSASADQLVVSFPGLGIWIRRGHADWIQIDDRTASVLLTAELIPGANRADFAPRAELIVGVPGAGLRVYTQQGLVPSWTLIHPFDVRRVVTGDLFGRGLVDLVVDFGPQYGLWTVDGLATWTHIHPFASAALVTADLDGLGRDDIVVDFGAPYGLWKYSPSTFAWQSLRSTSVDGLVTGGFH